MRLRLIAEEGSRAGIGQGWGSKARIRARRVQGGDEVLFERQGYRARLGFRVLTKYYSRLLSKDQTIWVLKIYIYVCVCGLD